MSASSPFLLRVMGAVISFMLDLLVFYSMAVDAVAKKLMLNQKGSAETGLNTVIFVIVANIRS